MSIRRLAMLIPFAGTVALIALFLAGAPAWTVTLILAAEVVILYVTCCTGQGRWGR